MFRDRRISCLTHVLYVLYALSILVGSPFMFPNPCWILYVILNPCRIYIYAWNPCQIYIYAWNPCRISYITFSMHLSVDLSSKISLLKTPFKGFKTSPRSFDVKPNNATIFGEWIVKSAHILLVMNSDFQGCPESPFWPTTTIFRSW